MGAGERAAAHFICAYLRCLISGTCSARAARHDAPQLMACLYRDYSATPRHSSHQQPKHLQPPRPALAQSRFIASLFSAAPLPWHEALNFWCWLSRQYMCSISSMCLEHAASRLISARRICIDFNIMLQSLAAADNRPCHFCDDDIIWNDGSCIAQHLLTRKFIIRISLPMALFLVYYSYSNFHTLSVSPHFDAHQARRCLSYHKVKMAWGSNAVK